MDILKTILIADDEEALRALLEAALVALDYEVVGAAGSRDALERVRKLRPQMVVLDAHRPEFGGLEAAKEIIALRTSALVLLTPDNDRQKVRDALCLGVSGVLQKESPAHQIGAALEAAWNRFQTIGALENQTRALTETLELRKLTERAKGILMDQQGISEEEAHRILQKMSQDQGIPLKEVCRSVVQVKMVLGRTNRPRPLRREP